MQEFSRVLVLGFTRRTSFALSKALLSKGCRVAVSDSVKNDEKSALLAELRAFGVVEDFLGNQSPEILDTGHFDLVLPSPGVPMSVPLLREAATRGIEIIGDIELFFRIYPDNTYIAITGTDGKTTTTTLVHEIVKRERKAVVGGNIGLPLFEHFGKLDSDTVVVLELSSFQLEGVKRFRPRAAALLNIAEDHLDRYPGVREYMLAKKNIFKNQLSADTAVLNSGNAWFDEVREGVASNVLSFRSDGKPADASYDAFSKTVLVDGKPYVRRGDIRMQGIHNVENAMAAILLCRAVGITDDTIRSVLSEFPGVEHRIEYVRTVDGADYFNDSKATTVNAMEKALQSFDRPVILLAGGRDKGLDFTKIRDLAHRKLKELVLVGEASEKIDRMIGYPAKYYSASFEDAVLHARASARPGDVVLLSPGCTSYDQFQNFEERGRKFKEIVGGF